MGTLQSKLRDKSSRESSYYCICRTPGGYHVGFTQDVSQLVDTLHLRYSKKRFYLCGFSLGGNVSLKFLGELGEKAIEKNIYGGAVTCVPFDPAGCQRKIDSGINRLIYSSV